MKGEQKKKRNKRMIVYIFARVFFFVPVKFYDMLLRTQNTIFHELQSTNYRHEQNGERGGRERERTKKEPEKLIR